MGGSSRLFEQKMGGIARARLALRPMLIKQQNGKIPFSQQPHPQLRPRQGSSTRQVI
jgi:hypothetical protein